MFQLEAIGIDDDILDTGGDSLSALTLMLEIERQWNIVVTIADMFGAPTVS